MEYTKNKLLKNVKDGDYVFIYLASLYNQPVTQICKVNNVKYHKDNEWFDFDGKVIYTNTRLHKGGLSPAGNCYSITEIVNPEIIEQFAISKNLFKAELYLLSDAELELINNLSKSKIRFF